MNPSEIKIFPILYQDERTWKNFAEIYAASLPKNKLLATLALDEFLENWYDYQDTIVSFGAYYKQDMVGFISGWVDFEQCARKKLKTEKLKKRAFISNLFLLPEFQHKALKTSLGVGSRLLSAAEKSLCLDYEICDVELYFDRRASGLYHFYNAHGYNINDGVATKQVQKVFFHDAKGEIISVFHCTDMIMDGCFELMQNCCADNATAQRECENFRRAVELRNPTFVYRICGKIVAFLYGDFGNLKVGELDRIYVHPDYRNCGTGRLLVNKFCDMANVFGVKKITVCSLGKALGFYEKCGFQFRLNRIYNAQKVL